MANKWYRINTTTLNIREGSGTNYKDVGDLFLNDQIEVSETIGGWHHIVRARRKDQDIAIPDVAWCSAAYTVEIASPVPEPNPNPEPQPTRKPLRISFDSDEFDSLTVIDKLTIELNPKP